MKFLARNWKSRTLVLLIIAVVFSLIMWALEFTQWAMGMNEAALMEETNSNSEARKGPPPALMMVLPFVKVFVMTAVPASLVVGIRALYRKISSLFRPKR